MKRVFTSCLFVVLLFSQAALISQTIWNGPSMTFTKADFADPTKAENQDRIMNDIWITRGNTRPIFNAYVDNMDESPLDTRWAYGKISDGVENLRFDYWGNTIGWSPLEMVDSNMVVHLITDDIYIDIKFTSWTSGEDNGGGGFSYERSTGTIGQKLWTGPAVTVTKTDYADWTLAANQDRITENVWITRADSMGLFNIASETGFYQSDGYYNTFIGTPTDTEWAYGEISDGVETLKFYNWADAIDWNPLDMIDSNMVLHLITDDIYIDIMFTSWTTGRDNGGGGFSYERSTGTVGQKLWTGPAITFTKADSADWTLEANQDRITDNVWITRADNQGLFNIVNETGFFNNSTIPTNTLWAFGTTADGVENLDFNYFLVTIDEDPPSMVGQDMVLKLVPYDIYIDIVFNSWTSGEDSKAPKDTRWAFGTIADGVETLEFTNWIDAVNNSPGSMVNNDMVLFLVTDSIYIDIKFTTWASGNSGGGFSYERSTGNTSETLWTGSKITVTKDNFADWTLEANQDRITENVWLTRADNQGLFNIAKESSYDFYQGGGGFSYTRSTNPAVSVPQYAENNSLICYPNPANDYISLNKSFKSDRVVFELYDIQGKNVFSSVVLNGDRISVSEISNGMYIYKINDAGTVYSGKLLIE